MAQSNRASLRLMRSAAVPTGLATRPTDSLDMLDQIADLTEQPWETVYDSWGNYVDVNLDTGEVRPSKRRPPPRRVEVIWR